MTPDDKSGNVWRKHAIFLAKALPATAAVMAVVLYLGSRFTIGIDPQESVCLGHRVFVVDHHDITPVRGKPFQFYARNMKPYFADNTPIIKMLDAVPGDRVQVTEHDVRVNGVAVAKGLGLREKLKQPESRFARDEYMGRAKFWFMGRTVDSFDSRYWGTVDQSQIVGRAYPIW